LRRSELVALDVVDMEHVRRGIVLHLRRSKTDQDCQGHNIAIPYGRSRWCPVACLDAWLSASRAGHPDRALVFASTSNCR
jgi:hypothetical protein